MPTYEYACKACGEHLEVVQAFTDDPLTKCPVCKKKQLRKVFGSIGITFKGSGFYKTDSRSGSSSSSSSTSSSGDSGSSSSSSETSSSSSDSSSDGKKSETKKSDAKSSDAKSSKSGTTAA